MSSCPEWCVDHFVEGGDVTHQGDRASVDLPCDAGTVTVWLSWPPTVDEPVLVASTTNRAEAFELSAPAAAHIASQFEALAAAIRARAHRGWQEAG